MRKTEKQTKRSLYIIFTPSPYSISLSEEGLAAVKRTKRVGFHLGNRALAGVRASPEQLARPLANIRDVGKITVRHAESVGIILGQTLCGQLVQIA